MNAITKGGYQDVPMSRRRAQLLAEYAERLATMLENAPDDKDLAEWVQSKIDRAASAIQSAYHYLDQEDDLEKGAGHKYTHRKRVGTDKRGRARYRYYYQEHHGGGITRAKLEAGSAFKLTFRGRRGHFHVESVQGDIVTVKHDGRPDSKPVEMTKAEFRALIKRQHGQALASHTEKLRRQVDKLKRNPTRKRSSLGLELHRLRQAAEKAGVTLPEEYQRKPKKKTAQTTETPREDRFDTMPEVESEVVQGQDNFEGFNSAQRTALNKIVSELEELQREKSYIKSRDIGAVSVQNKIEEYISSGFLRDQGLAWGDYKGLRGLVSSYDVSSKVSDLIKERAAEIDLEPETMREQLKDFVYSVVTDTLRIVSREADNRQSKWARLVLKRFETPQTKQEQAQHFFDVLGIAGFKGRRLSADGDTARVDIKGKDDKIGFIEFTEQGVNFDSMPELKEDQREPFNEARESADLPLGTRQGGKSLFDTMLERELARQKTKIVFDHPLLQIENVFDKRTYRAELKQHFAGREYERVLNIADKHNRSILSGGIYFNSKEDALGFAAELTREETPQETLERLEDFQKRALQSRKIARSKTLTDSEKKSRIRDLGFRDSRPVSKTETDTNAQDIRRLKREIESQPTQSPETETPREDRFDTMPEVESAESREPVQDERLDTMPEVEDLANKKTSRERFLALRGYKSENLIEIAAHAFLQDKAVNEEVDAKVRELEREYKDLANTEARLGSEEELAKEGGFYRYQDAEQATREKREEIQNLLQARIDIYNKVYRSVVLHLRDQKTNYVERRKAIQSRIKELTVSVDTSETMPTARDQLTSTAQEIITEADQDHDERHDEHQSIEQFELGEHTHTKTGVKLFTAKQKGRTDRDEYRRRVEIAKKHGGRYERRYVKGFLFKTAEDARNFALEVEGGQVEESAETVTPHEDHPQADNFETMPEVEAEVQNQGAVRRRKEALLRLRYKQLLTLQDQETEETLDIEENKLNELASELLQARDDTRQQEIESEIQALITTSREKVERAKEENREQTNPTELPVSKIINEIMAFKSDEIEQVKKYIKGYKSERYKGANKDLYVNEISNLLSTEMAVNYEDLSEKYSEDTILQIIQKLEADKYTQDLESTIAHTLLDQEQAPEPDPSPARQALTETSDEIISEPQTEPSVQASFDTDAIQDAIDNGHELTPVITLQKQFIEKRDAGLLTPALLQESLRIYETMIEGVVEAKIKKKKKGVLLSYIASNINAMTAYRLKSEKKQNAIDEMMSSFLRNVTNTPLMRERRNNVTYNIFDLQDRETDIERIKRLVSEYTEEDAIEDNKRLKAEIEQAKQRQAEKERLLSNPQTAQDFIELKRLRRNKGEDLSAEQHARHNDLVARSRRGKREDEKTKQAPQKTITGGFESFETKHSKTGADLYAVRPAERVGRDEYLRLKAEAKKQGGYYSSYRTVRGFVFPTPEAREQFIQANQQPEAEPQEPVDKQRAKRDALRERLEGYRDSANEALNADRRTNTARRARFARYATEDAFRRIEYVNRGQRILNAIDEGRAYHLQNISNATDLDMLQSIVNRAKSDDLSSRGLPWSEYEKEQDRLKNTPIEQSVLEGRDLYPDKLMLHPSDLKSLKKYLTRSDGTARRGARTALAELNAMLSEPKEKRHVVSMDTLMRVLAHVPPEADKSFGVLGRVVELKRDHDRMKRLGIETEVELKAALREYEDIVYQRSAEDEKAHREAEEAKAERDRLIRRGEFARMNIPSYFPTPTSVIDRMIEIAGIEEGETVLEPSAGAGHILEKLADTQASVKAIETNYTLRNYLEDQGHEVVGNDALEHSDTYDHVIMNPPFEKQADIEHVTHAFENNLVDGGRLVAVMSASAMTRDNKKARDFQDLVNKYGHYERLPEGTFKDSDRQTGVNTILVVLDLPDSGLKKSFYETLHLTNYRADLYRTIERLAS